MQVALFIPCYIDQLYPQVGIATLQLLEQYGCEVVYPPQQTCCGQPMANTGCVDDAKPVAEHFLRTFADYPYIVCPSGSCTAMIRQHYEGILPPSPRLQAVTTKTYELCEFLVDVLEVDGVAGRFPYRVGLHNSCHGLRELRLGSCTERVMPAFNKARQLLETLQDITFVELDRQDECCGFGGTFAVGEVDVSVTMGKDRLADHQRHGAEIVTATDMSCLMHLYGIISRQRLPLKVMHVAEILAGHQVPA